jgi:hypothetical protein
VRVIGLEQIGIAIFGVAAIRLSQDEREKVRRWACIAGLCSQPFWFLFDRGERPVGDLLPVLLLHLGVVEGRPDPLVQAYPA